MKVLYIINSLKPYGAEKSIVQTAVYFKTVTPIFVILSSVESDLILLLKTYGIKSYQLNLNKEDSTREALNAIIPIIKSEKPKILHSMLFQSDMIARKLKQIFPYIILVGSLVNNSYSKKRYANLDFISRLKLFTTQLRDRITIKYVDYFISNSQAIVKPNIKALGISRENIRVIHRGRKINNESIKSLEDTLIQKTKNKIVFLNVGRLSRNKGQLDLIQAFKKIQSKRKDIILLLAGEGSLRTEMEKEIDKFGLHKIIHLLGYRTDVSSLLHHTNFCIFPSYVEGLSGAIIEAVLAKKPCIVSNIEENKECFPNEDGALFFPVGNVSKMIESIDKALSLNEKEWKEMVNSSFEFGREHFDILRASERYEYFYKKIL